MSIMEPNLNGSHQKSMYIPDIGALAKKSNDNALSLVFKIANE